MKIKFLRCTEHLFRHLYPEHEDWFFQTGSYYEAVDEDEFMYMVQDKHKCRRAIGKRVMQSVMASIPTAPEAVAEPSLLAVFEEYRPRLTLRPEEQEAIYEHLFWGRGRWVPQGFHRPENEIYACLKRNPQTQIRVVFGEEYTVLWQAVHTPIARDWAMFPRVKAGDSITPLTVILDGIGGRA